MRYGIHRRLKRGIRLDLIPSWRCNMSCDYCILKRDGKMPVSKIEHDYKYWINYIETFPIKVGEVFISGGEPGLYPNIEELVNYLLDSGRLVTIFTNLTNILFSTSIKPSNKLRFNVMRHDDVNDERFDIALRAVRSLKHRVDVGNFKANPKYPNEYTKKIETSQCNTIEKNHLRTAPNGAIFRTQKERRDFYEKIL